jgi:hypothetical protein
MKRLLALSFLFVSGCHYHEVSPKYEPLSKYMQPRVSDTVPLAPQLDSRTAFDAAVDLRDIVRVGNEYRAFEDGLLRTSISQWRRLDRTDYGGGAFSETYRIAGDYLSFMVEGGRFTRVSGR